MVATPLMTSEPWGHFFEDLEEEKIGQNRYGLVGRKYSLGKHGESPKMFIVTLVGTTW